MDKIERLQYNLKKSKLENEILKEENEILTKLNEESNYPLNMNQLISNLKVQNNMLIKENRILLNKIFRSRIKI
tara:strand:+ start:5983 stop:6204 length:222 start_codon:yes stop_codon:yes gene_type:complete